ncbi:MAG: hypothetical protein R6V13_03700 [Anaerolineae bacterium]
MKKTRLLTLLLISCLLFTGLLPSIPPKAPERFESPVSPLAALPVHADATESFQGRIVYRARGPAMYATGLGAGLVLGGVGAPAALLRVQNMLLEGLELISRYSDDLDETSVEEITSWAHEGIPMDLADVGIQGYYEAQIDFILEDVGDGVMQLQSGSVRWKGYNEFESGHDKVRIRDSFQDSGRYTLDPTVDTISLTPCKGRDGDAQFETRVEIRHPCTVSGESEIVLARIPIMRLEADQGRVVMDSAFPMFSDNEVLFDGSEMATLNYSYRAPVDEIHHHVKTWRDLLDSRVVVETQIRLLCETQIVSPQDEEQLTFDNSKPGTLQFTAEAEASSNREDELEDLIWVFPEIGDSELSTEPQDARGNTVRVTYTGLPESNDDFGEHEISAYYDSDALCSPPDPIKIQVFFPRDAANNPLSLSGGTAASAGDGVNQIPNWFYYWRQTSAAQGLGEDQILYGGDGRDRIEGETEDGEEITIVVMGSYKGYYADDHEHPDANRIYVYDLGVIDFTYTNFITELVYEGIDAFGCIVRHERTHMENYQDWWAPDGYLDQRAVKDEDGDCVPDELEEGLELDPKDKDTWDIGMDDEEYLAYTAETNWGRGSANDEDWANPGKQIGADR